MLKSSDLLDIVFYINLSYKIWVKKPLTAHLIPATFAIRSVFGSRMLLNFVCRSKINFLTPVLCPNVIMIQRFFIKSGEKAKISPFSESYAQK